MYTKRNVFRVLNYLSLIPFLGYLIAVFYGAYMINKTTKKRKAYVFTFMFLSLICLTLFAGFAVVIIYFFLIGIVVTFQIVLILLLCYISFMCAALTSNAIHKGIIEKLKNQEDERIKENLY